MLSLQNKNFGFIILNPLRDIWAQRSTSRVILRTFDCNCICVAPKDTTKEELKQMNEHCQTYKFGNTFTDLINKGLEKATPEFNVIVMAGVSIRPGIFNKYRLFLNNNKEILYPIVNGKYQFDEATLNGLLIPKQAIKEIGKFKNEEDIGLSKLAWADKANSLGYKFKAIAGVKIL